MLHYSSTAGEMSLMGTISDTATSMIISTTTGLPAVPFEISLDYGSGSEEVVEVTNVSGTTLTIGRGKANTVAVPHTAGARVIHVASSTLFNLIAAHIEGASEVHGAGPTDGDIVAEDKAQTLTNKTIDGDLNTFVDVPGSALKDATVTQAKLTGAINVSTVAGIEILPSATDPQHVGMPVGSIWVPIP